MVSDSRIQVERKIIMDTKKIRDSPNWLSLKERKKKRGEKNENIVVAKGFF